MLKNINTNDITRQLFDNLKMVNANYDDSLSQPDKPKDKKNANINYDKSLSRAINKTKMKNKKIIIEKYENLPIKLTGKYLEDYNNYTAYIIYKRRLYESGFFEYQCKLKQYLSSCGLNRTTQYYGTCWFNCIINSIVFSNKIRSRFLQLLSSYMANHPEFVTMTEQINKNAHKLSEKIDYNEANIFKHFISLLYKILCSEGLRNETDKYDNMSLTNIALNIRKTKSLPEIIKQFDMDKPIDILNSKNIGFSASNPYDILINIFNKYNNNNEHLLYMHKNNNNHVYTFNNYSHFNKLTVYISNDMYYGVYSDIYTNKHFQNINVDINYNSKKQNIKSFSSNYSINNIDNVNFIFFEYSATDVYLKIIPDTITCSVNKKQTIFKLDCAIIYIAYSDNSAHGVTGFICNNEYFIYDSACNYYYQIDWRMLTIENFKPYTYSDPYKKCVKIGLEIAFYYNTGFDFSYNIKDCNPRRPK